jgi:NAD(P)-dependent dehydrogenase (short-subunit alcohol dehydrogenase family)
MKTVLITGASRGIGAATAILAARRGYAVCVNYKHDETAAQNVASDIKSLGGTAITVAADIAIETDVIRLFNTCQQQLGSIDALVNNAGILEKQMRLEHMDINRMQRIINVNVIGSLLCAREAVKHMSIKHGGAGGAIVNLSSAAARLGAPNEYIDYAASKGAIDSLTIGLAKEVAEEGIRVNAVRPGLIHTEMHASGGEPGRIERLKNSVPVKRGGTAEEVAHAILWLLSDESSYVTGTILDVTGGR